MNIDIAPQDLKTIKALLHQYLPHTLVWAFGSRVKFTAKPSSDLDLVAFSSQEQAPKLSLLQEAFEQSNIPFRIDLHQWHELPETFHQYIENHYAILQANTQQNTPNNWKTYKLSDIAQMIGGGTPKTTVDEYWNGNIPWLSVVDFGKSTKIVYTTEKTITEKGLQESSTKILKKGQLIISARGTVGELAMLGKDMAFNQSCYGLNATKETTNEFLYYLVKYNIGKIKQNTHGAVFDTITKQTFENIEVTIPSSIEEQTQIAEILSSLDDKIELNLQMNQTLEAIAQALFKEWCCVEDEIIPEGWEWKKISDIADVCSSKRIFRDEYISNGVPFYRGKEVTQLSNGEAISTELFISGTRYSEIKEKFGVPQIGDILITSVGTIGSIWLVDNDAPFYFKDGNVTWIKGYKTAIKGEFIYQWLQTKEAKEQINSVSIGSTQQALTISALRELNILIPSNEVIIRTCTQLEKINAKRISNTLQIRTLTETRDALLPKLMSGQIAL